MKKFCVTRLEENGKTKVRGLERRVLIFAKKQKVLRLEVPMHDPHGVTVMHNSDDLTAQRSGSSLRVVALSDNPIKELPTLAELHHQVHRVPVLVRSLQLDDVAVAGQMVHDLHLAPHILDVITVDELPRGDRLAGKPLARPPIGGQVRDAKLATTKLTAEGVELANIGDRTAKNTAVHRAGGRRWGWLGGGEDGDGTIGGSWRRRRRRTVGRSGSGSGGRRLSGGRREAVAVAHLGRSDR